MSFADKDVFYSPPLLKNSQGDDRRVGFELEFAGLGLNEVSQIVADSLGGRYELQNQAESLVDVPGLGQFIVELDWGLAKQLARERATEKQQEGQYFGDDLLMEWTMRLARELVPVEIVCPPVPFQGLHVLNRMIQPLRQAGALGTEESLLYAFGVHLNPEIPDFKPATVLSWLQAFGLMQSWLIKVHHVDLARRITPYIDTWPVQYVKELFGMNKNTVTQDQLIDHYIKFNPTRNRALDMLPLFKYLDEQRVLDRIDDARINARPTFHYRLPNCEINREGWCLADSWNVWCVVEVLANDDALRSTMIPRWFDYQNNFINFSSPPWHQDLDQIKASLS